MLMDIERVSEKLEKKIFSIRKENSESCEKLKKKRLKNQYS